MELIELIVFFHGYRPYPWELQNHPQNNMLLMVSVSNC